MQIDLDNLIDYRAAYDCIEGAKVSGDNLTGLCPFHQDSNASFSVNLQTGLYKCFACGAEGNYVSFVANQRGISTKDAYLAILQERGLADDGVKTAKKSRAVCPDSYTVEDYAKEKGLDAAWLRSNWGMNEGRDKKVGAFVRIPYFNENQEQVLFRKRYPKGASQRFSWGNGSAGKLIPYGSHLLGKIREAGYAVLVEGESDTHTLWSLNIPALGVPGATTFKSEWVQELLGVKLYLHEEPDNGGKSFRTSVTRKLYAAEFPGEVFSFSCGSVGCKDPSELLLKCGGAEAKNKLHVLIEEARQIDLAAENEVQAIPGAPKNLKQPEGWIYSERGISIIEEKTQQPKCICRTPIILTKRMRNELGEEKIEVAFRRDGQWNTAIFPRTVVFQSKSVTCLSDLGCTITSENAKQVVAFLQALEAENMETLELVDSTSHCGWQSKDRFIPGLGGDLVLDVSPQMQSVASGYCKNGTPEQWAEGMRRHRERPIFRAYLAASFAAPMLKLLGVRNFIFYNWADSGSGKTAALKAALSVWGDPNRLMISFDSTKIALERRATFFCDLPFGIDERQSAGDRQGFLENLTYMLANGVGRARGSKEEGGVQNVLSWRTVALMTGEEPLMQNATKGGVSNRTLEVYGGPFDDELQAVQMHQCCDENCGWAGPMFVSELIRLGTPILKEQYQRWLKIASDILGAKKQAHAAAIAVLALADELSSGLIWHQGDEDARQQAERMVREIARSVTESEPDDVNDRALQFVQNWVLTNWKNFQGADNAPIYGWIDGEQVCILSNCLREAMMGAGFSERKSLRAFAESGALLPDRDGKSSQSRYFAKTKSTARVCVFRRSMLLGSSEDGQTSFQMIDVDEPLPF